MKIQSAFAQHKNTEALIENVFSQLDASAISPSILFAFFNTEHDVNTIQQALHNKYQCPALLASSCLGALGNNAEQFHALNDLVIFALEDANGHYGVGSASTNNQSPREAANQAMMAALENSDVPYESPALVWCAMPPGNEEEMLAGFADVIGPNIPVFGGSAADNDVSGQWQQGCHNDTGEDRVVVAVLYNSTPMGMSYSSGYKPTNKVCVATDVDGRVLHQLDNDTAANVYDALTDHSIAASLKGGNVLGDTTLYPLGQEIESTLGIPEYLLSHPDSVTEDGALTLFSEIDTNTQLIVMEGSVEGLVARAEKVVNNAIGLLPEGSSPQGVLMIYCAGCMLTVDDNISTMLEKVRARVGDIPVAAAYTFGEQGRFLDGVNRHGNLMISAVVFGS